METQVKIAILSDNQDLHRAISEVVSLENDDLKDKINLIRLELASDVEDPKECDCDVVFIDASILETVSRSFVRDCHSVQSVVVVLSDREGESIQEHIKDFSSKLRDKRIEYILADNYSFQFKKIVVSMLLNELTN